MPGKNGGKRIKDGWGNEKRPMRTSLINLKSSIMMFTLARLDISVFFYNLPENSLCVYVFTTMVELQVHFSRTNWLFLDIHSLCLKGKKDEHVHSLHFGVYV